MNSPTSQNVGGRFKWFIFSLGHVLNSMPFLCYCDSPRKPPNTLFRFSRDTLTQTFCYEFWKIQFAVHILLVALPEFYGTGFNPFRSYVGPRPTLWFSCSRRFSWFLTLSNPIFLPPEYSPAPIYFGRERGWWITCNYPTVLKEKNRNRNRNRKSTACDIWRNPTLWFSRSRRFSSCSTDFSQQISQVVLFLFMFFPFKTVG
jgi:hypothetical protein